MEVKMNINPEQLIPGKEYITKGKVVKHSPFGANEPQLVPYSQKGTFLSGELEQKTGETVLYFDKFVLRYKLNMSSNHTYKLGHFVTIENIEAVENERINGRKTREKVVYRNGRITENIADFVKQQLSGVIYAEIVMSLFVRRPSKSSERSYEMLLREYGYPILNRNRQ